MKFEVPQELAPGVYRPGIGLVRPGEVLELPDKASKALDKPGKPSVDGFHPALVPLDKESYEALSAWQQTLKGPLKDVKIRKPGEVVPVPQLSEDAEKRNKLKDQKVK
jgi:hypothetical protein